MKKLLSVLLSAVMIFSAVIPVAAFAEVSKATTAESVAVQSSVNSDIKGAIKYLNIEQTVANSYNVHTLAKAGGDVSRYIAALDENLKANNGKIMASQSTEQPVSEDLMYYAVAIDTLTFLGKDVTNYNGYNIQQAFETLAEKNMNVSNPYFYRCIIEACVNIKNDTLGKAFADAMLKGYTMGKGYDYWGYSCDNTCMLIASIAPYKDLYMSYIDDALKLVEGYKKEKGYYSDEKYLTDANADSTAYVIMAYSAVGDYDAAYGAYKLLTANFESKANDGVFLNNAAEDKYATMDVLRALPYFDATQIYHNFNGDTCTVCGTTRATAGTTPTPAPKPAAPAQPSKPVSVKPAKTSIKKISPGKKSFTVKWKKISNISAYQVQIATNKKFTKNKKTFKVSKKSTKVKIKNLKAKKKYYVRVRSYKTVNGKRNYSKWSAIKTVKTK